MIVLCVTNAPLSLRGDLSKWLNEINTGVYVGKLSARVREQLWERVCSNIKSGQATMVYSANNEQGFLFLCHNTIWQVKDYEGIMLMQKPLHNNMYSNETLQYGFSKAAKFEKIKHLKYKNKLLEYVIMDIKSTGFDEITTEIGLLRVNEDNIEDKRKYVIKTNKEKNINNDINADIFDKVKVFVEDFVVVGYDIKRCTLFFQSMANKLEKKNFIKRTKDIYQLARKRVREIDNYNLKTISNYFSLDFNENFDIIKKGILIKNIFSKLNEK